MTAPRFLVFGAAGMLGGDLVDELRRRGCTTSALTIEEVDITDAAACRDALDHIRPDVVVNCAAYTAVDAAETDKAAAFAVNAEGAGNVARACGHALVRCVYVSTDYVFDGTKTSPYTERDVPRPLGVYGRSKLEGERRVAFSAPNHAIVRSSWLFGRRGRNFVTTMLAAAESGRELAVVDDQIGAPTYTRDLSRVLADIALCGRTGIFHATASGACTWHGFARAIFDLSGVIPRALRPVPTEAYPVPAPRPRNSRLAMVGLADAGIAPIPDWSDGLRRYLEEIGRLADSGCQPAPGGQ